MKKRSAEEVAAYLTELMLEYLDDLKDVADAPFTQFEYGEKTAYTEIAEILSEWEGAAECGLNFNVEQKYPL